MIRINHIYFLFYKFDLPSQKIKPYVLKSIILYSSK